MYLCIYLCVSLYVCDCVCIYKCMHLSLCECAFVLVCFVCVYVQIYVYVYFYVYVCVFASILLSLPVFRCLSVLALLFQFLFPKFFSGSVYTSMFLFDCVCIHLYIYIYIYIFIYTSLQVPGLTYKKGPGSLEGFTVQKIHFLR